MDYIQSKLSLKGPFFSLDVECVAIGKTHLNKDRYPGKFALVDETGKLLCSSLIKPEKPIVSYLTPLSGLRESDFRSAKCLDLQSAFRLLKQHLPKEAILVGQKIELDIQWMHLTEGTDFQDSVDIAEVFKGWNSKYNNMAYHSLLHEAEHVLNINIDHSKEHSPLMDAELSIRLWNKVKEDPSKLPHYQQMLIRNRPRQSVAKRLGGNYEGVCLSKFRPSSCICGMPTGKR